MHQAKESSAVRLNRIQHQVFVGFYNRKAYIVAICSLLLKFPKLDVLVCTSSNERLTICADVHRPDRCSVCLNSVNKR